MSKHVWLVITGSGDESEGREVNVEKETTARDLIEVLDLKADEYGLQLQQKDGGFSALSNQEKVYSKVKEGDKLHVFPTKMIVGAIVS